MLGVSEGGSEGGIKNRKLGERLNVCCSKQDEFGNFKGLLQCITMI